MAEQNIFDIMTHLTVQNEQDIDEHILTLFSLTVSMKPTHIFELGVRTARSSLAFLAASQIVGSKVVSVDLNPPQPDFGFPEDWFQNWMFLQKNALRFLEEDLSTLKDPCDKAQQKHENLKRCDIFYIDDWHASDHVKKEIELIDTYATPKDLIILHDLMYGNSQPHYKSVDNPADPQWGAGGPYRAIAELDLDKWEYMTIPRCNGLTLLRKKSPLIIERD